MAKVCEKPEYLIRDDGSGRYTVTKWDGGMHARIQCSAYMMDHFGACGGCFKVARRKIKVMLILLYKLGIELKGHVRVNTI